MKITKRGYIARVAFNIYQDAIPAHALTVTEMEAYPKFHFIERERAEKFLLHIEALSNWLPMSEPHRVIFQEILFGEQWNDIVKSFDGQEPEILIQDIHLGIKTTMPEDLKIKLRYATDENGKQIIEGQLFAKKMDMLDSAIWTKTKRQDSWPDENWFSKDSGENSTKEQKILEYGRLAAPIIGQSIAQSLKRFDAKKQEFEDWREIENTMKITKRGYIARVVSKKYPNRIPECAFAVAELGAYPEFYFIKKERAEKFLLTIDATLTWMKNFPADMTILKEILFGTQWNDIVKSFDGQEPEIIVFGKSPNNFYVIPGKVEDLSVKLRLMLDENGNKITEDQLFAKRMDMLDLATLTKIKRESEEWCIPKDDCQMVSVEDLASHREQKIFRLVEHEKALAMENVKEYEFRIRKMSDEQIEKEYRMEFGSDETS